MTNTAISKVARWESRSGKYFVELYHDDSGYTYRSDNSGGFMGKCSLEQAIARCEQEASYCPSKLNRVAVSTEGTL